MATASELQRQQLLSLIGANRDQNTSGRFGGIVSYDKFTNTATVIISRQSSNQVEQILKNVQCPVMTGIQAVSPSPGKPCWVVFKDGNINQPLITHFFNHEYSGNEYHKQNNISFAIPSFMMR